MKILSNGVLAVFVETARAIRYDLPAAIARRIADRALDEAEELRHEAAGVRLDISVLAGGVNVKPVRKQPKAYFPPL